MRWLLVLLLAASGAGADDWQRIVDRDGIVVERRSVDGSSIREVRVTGHSPLPPAAIMATLWKQSEYPQFVPYVKRVDLLRDEGDERLVYEQFHVPLLKDRDVTLRARRTFTPETGIYEVSTVAIPGGPAETGDYVRVRTSESHWRLVPCDGGTAVDYSLRADPGGLVPGWIVNAAQKDASVKLFRAMLDRALRNSR